MRNNEGIQNLSNPYLNPREENYGQNYRNDLIPREQNYGQNYRND